MFKTCSDPDFNWVHCLCDSATWVVKEPGKPIGFFYSRLFDDALSPSGLGFAVDAFRITRTARSTTSTATSSGTTARPSS